MPTSNRVYNTNIISETIIPTPAEVKEQLPLSIQAEATVLDGRSTIQRILDRQDPRRLLIVGPCSIHNVELAIDYATRLRRLAREVKDVFVVVMRVYFEKPRTAIGWKGLINDPRLDDSFRIDDGLKTARRLLLDLNEMGVPTGTEALDPVVPQYISDLISWYAIGARTTESQTHREIASGLSAPIGFKNGTDGNLDIAVMALRAAASPHSFLGVSQDGRSAVFRTRGNRYGHVVLRGGKTPNYQAADIATCEQILARNQLPTTLVVDCSHANSSKDHTRQPLVFDNCIEQIQQGNTSIVGMMLESNIAAGRQDIPQDLTTIKYGVSVTDACIDWETTERTILDGAAKIRSLGA